MNRLGVYNALTEKLKCDIGSVLIMMYKGKNFKMSNKSSLPQLFLFLDSQIKNNMTIFICTASCVCR